MQKYAEIPKQYAEIQAKTPQAKTLAPTAEGLGSGNSSYRKTECLWEKHQSHSIVGFLAFSRRHRELELAPTRKILKQKIGIIGKTNDLIKKLPNGNFFRICGNII